MNFASLEFGVFLAAVYALYIALPHRAQNRMLLVASYLFYGAWDWRFLGLLLFSTVVDYNVARVLGRMPDSRKRRWVLAISVAVNLGLLAVFKYFNFFSDSMARLLETVGLGSWATGVTLHVVLPVGISFYTFQTLSYTIDVYRRKLPPAGGEAGGWGAFLDFALFVAFFPQLVAGPIERATHLLPQVLRPRVLTFDQTTRGLFLILLGLVKKVAVADGVAQAVAAVYGSSGRVGTLDILLATYLFAVQIYCDFSAYSDIARGVSKLLGFDLIHNFNVPYASTNPSEFWRRWHISLSTWLRDYLYIPLGGNRGGKAATYRNLMLTMGLGGLWHGAAWNYVLWGVYQGALLCGHRLIGSGGGAGSGGAPATEPERPSVAARLGRLLVAALFFQLVVYGWLLFRAQSLEQIQRFTAALLTQPPTARYVSAAPTLAALAGLPVLGILDLAQYLTDDPQVYRRWPLPVRSALYAVLVLVLLMGLSNARAEFIYFQF